MPTSAAEEARDDYLAGQIARHDEELAELRRSQSETIASAVEAGITRAVSNPELWAAASKALQLQAKAHAGGWLFGTIGALFSKLGLFMLAGIAIYMMGGWTALLAFVKTLGPP